MINITRSWAAIVLAVTVCISVVGDEAATKWTTINGGEAHPTQLLARFTAENQVSQARMNRLVAEYGYQVAHQYKLVPGLVLLSLANEQAGIKSLGNYGKPGAPDSDFDLAGALQTLTDSGLFQYVEPDYISKTAAEPRDASYRDGTLWGLRNRGADAGTFGVRGADINASRAWDVTQGSRDVIVGVIDSGIWYTHQELAPQMWRNPGEIPDNGVDDDENGFIDDVFGMNAVVETGDPLDDNGHGTHVAGIIGAAANDSGRVVGVAWDVQLMALKASDSFGLFVDSDVLQAIEYGVENGCQVLNASYGGPSFNQAVADMFRAAGQNNVLIVAAAGNESSDNDISPHYPSNYTLDNIIAVGSMNRLDQMSDFSNFGLVSVDIFAPGETIESTWFGADDEYQESSGTSQAAPYVSGIAVLVLSVFPDLGVFELRNRILESAVKRPTYSGLVATGGRVNAFGAFDSSPDGSLEIAVDPPSRTALVADSPIQFEVRVTDLVPVNGATVQAEIVNAVDVYPNQLGFLLEDQPTIPAGANLGADGELILANGLVVLPHPAGSDLPESERPVVMSLLDDGDGADADGNDAVYSAEIPTIGVPLELEIQLTVTHPEKEGVNTTVRYNLVERPVNDGFTSSIKLTGDGGTFVTSTSFATFQANEPRHAGVFSADKSLWWTWTPSRDSLALIDPSGSDFDTVIGVYTGNDLRELVEVASVDNIGARRDAFLQFPVQRGVGYRIAIAGADEMQSGTLRFRLEPDGQPDFVSPGVVIESPTSGLVVVQNTIEISGTAFDPDPNQSGINQVRVFVNSDLQGRLATGDTNWSVNVALEPGVNTVRAVAQDFSGNTSESEPIVINYFVPDPINDHFGNATVLEGVEDQAQGSNASATKQFGEPLHAGNLGGKSLWYSYTPTEDGTLDLFTRGSNFDTLLAVYVGEKVTELELIASNDDASGSISRITQAVRAGVRYAIAVDGFSGQSGAVNLRYTFTPGSAFNVAVSEVGSGSVSPGTGLQSGGEETVYTATPGPGFVFLGWEGSVESTENPLTVLVEADTELTAVFAPSVVSDDFESGGFTTLGYEFNGSQPWRLAEGIASTGDFSARSGAIGHNESSSMILRTTSPGGRGSFHYGVSSEEGWDFLEFYVNDSLRGRWSGNQDWQSFEFTVPAGDVVLEWRYTKDFANSDGADAAFVDNVNIPIGVPAAPATRLSVSGFGKTGLKLTINGLPNAEYLIETSSDLTSWQEFDRGTADGEGALRVVDPEAIDNAHRFFRAVQQ